MLFATCSASSWTTSCAKICSSDGSCIRLRKLSDLISTPKRSRISAHHFHDVVRHLLGVFLDHQLREDLFERWKLHQIAQAFRSDQHSEEITHKRSSLPRCCSPPARRLPGPPVARRSVRAMEAASDCASFPIGSALRRDHA